MIAKETEVRELSYPYDLATFHQQKYWKNGKKSQTVAWDL
jgi:hypothetical protein